MRAGSARLCRCGSLTELNMQRTLMTGSASFFACASGYRAEHDAFRNDGKSDFTYNILHFPECLHAPAGLNRIITGNKSGFGVKPRRNLKKT